MKKKVFRWLIVALILIQFIRPTRNESTTVGRNEIAFRYPVPGPVHNILKYSCYNCHSNNTQYPWYVNIQPVGWWMQSNVNDGKRHLNFSEFGMYSEKKARHQFEEIEDAATNGWMPLPSYLLLHADAKLTPEKSKALAEWAATLK